MKKRALAALTLLALLALPAYAGGGGGVEYGFNIGSDAIAEITQGSGFILDAPTGKISSIGGFGFGITPDGLKIGGFGFAVLSGNISSTLPGSTFVAEGVYGGFGGLIIGGYGRLGPLLLNVNTRYGVGGLAFPYTQTGLLNGMPYSYQTSIGVFSLFGSAEIEIGIRLFSAMAITVYGGLDAFVPLPNYMTSPVIAVPTAGIRLTWGYFQ